MLNFEQLSFKNLLSFGEQPTVINFNEHKTTLITGKNGHGKSTFLDAITFVLYGKPFRKIKLGMLVNSVNKKGCLVTIDFKSGSRGYQVRRGIKPAVFEIYEDGELLPQHGSSRDYQANFEKNILKMNYLAFTQVVILGKATYEPFMRLSTTARRPVIEDLLGLSIFSAMNKVLKGKVAKLKLDRAENDGEVRLAEQKAFAQEAFINQAKENRKANILRIKLNIAEVTQSIDTVDEKIALLEAERAAASRKVDQAHTRVAAASEQVDKAIAVSVEASAKAESLREDKPVDDVKELTKTVAKLEKKRNSLNEIRVKFGYRIESLEADVKFLTENPDCPTCKQLIHEDFRLTEVEKKTSKVKKIEDGKIDLQAQMNDIVEEINTGSKTIRTMVRAIADHDKSVVIADRAAQTAQSKVNDQHAIVRERNLGVKQAIQAVEAVGITIDSVRAGVAEQQRILDVHNKQLETARQEQDTTADDKKLAKLNRESKALVKTKAVLADKATYYATIAGMLKDSGIKTLIVDKYLPVFNQLINKHLNELGFFIKFNLDQEFNETILSRFRDKFTYESFSEGQKLRIDLAILLTWREIAKRKNSVSTNLLIMDEVFDSSLDVEGVEAFIDMIPNMEGTHIMVVSHTPDKLSDRFDAHLGFEMDGNFSVMRK